MWIYLVEEEGLEEGEVYTKQSGQQLLQLSPPPPPLRRKIFWQKTKEFL